MLFLYPRQITTPNTCLYVFVSSVSPLVVYRLYQVRAVCHTLAKDDDSDISGKTADEVAIPQYTDIPRAESPVDMRGEELDAFDKVEGIKTMVDASRRKESLMPHRGGKSRKTDLESSFLRNPGRGFSRLGGLKLAVS
jgi:hypothetical protein